MVMLSRQNVCDNFVFDETMTKPILLYVAKAVLGYDSSSDF